MSKWVRIDSPEADEALDKIAEKDPTQKPFVEAMKVIIHPVHKGHHWMTKAEVKAYWDRVIELLSDLMNK